MAVAAILLGLVISPIITTFNFTNRARRNVEVQDAARYAMEVMSREIADAMNVVVSDGDYEPFTYYMGGKPNSGEGVVVRGVGYIDAWDNAGNVSHNPSGKPWELPNAMVDLVLPHDALGLEGGVIQQPLVMQHQTVDALQHPIIVRYFVGLTSPNKTDASGHPLWQNNNVSRYNKPQNMYTLYRVEFDPYDPRYANWISRTAADGTMPDGKTKIYRVNPGFFYDQTVVAYNGMSKTQAEWWRRKSVAIMPTDSMDLVDFVRKDPRRPFAATSNPYLEARSLVTFNPLIVAADSAGAVGADREPATYKTQYGHWCGLQNDGTVPYTGYNPAPVNMLPHIVVYSQERDPETEAAVLKPQFDSAVSDSAVYECPANKHRELQWNSLKGTVDFSISAMLYDSAKSDAITSSMYDPLNKTPGQTLPSNSYITPGTEIVTVQEDNGPVVYSRSSSNSKDVYDVPDDIAVQNGSPKQLPPPRTYMVTNSGKVIIGYPYPSDVNPIQSQPVPAGRRVTISYYSQNNSPDDLVKVDYLTREMLSINLTARMYDPVTRNAITTTLANRVRIRNMQR